MQLKEPFIPRLFLMLQAASSAPLAALCYQSDLEKGMLGFGGTRGAAQ